MAERRYEYAPASTLPGLLQRGRGLGALMAAEDPAAAADLVYGCIRWEWRWDRQVDDRHLYLARLVRDLDLPLGPIVEQLAAAEDTCMRAARVLELLALDGSTEARDALNAYVQDGEHRELVLESVESMRSMADAPAPTRRTWADPLPERDSASLLAMLADPDVPENAKATALRALSRRAPEPALIPLVPTLGAADGTCQLPMLGRAVDVLGEQAVPAAREWATSDRPWLAGLGLVVLAGHGDESDLPTVLNELERAWVAQEWCGPDTLARGLARFGPRAADAASLLRRFWLWTPHSYERSAYLEALGALGAAGMDEAYTESLRDCEANARLLAVRRAPDGPRVRERLAYLRDDPMEEPEVREAARVRLAGVTS
ncbi:hypothetical protein F7Q99_05825 [Streptomyces kaniharaensis]|uniref:HEAT repeat domain-containing protein n=1 Tax=Streptomyces kaniharaensis TaxID=212423 RepID=A0A6N7KJZ2_9ACTN|nr:hypothetical protein [Streptomyces kaniharaensis]MQS11820.1 hypothetical protein [Streptomyces kaniharaensis]